jgi:hypothetical protein
MSGIGLAEIATLPDAPGRETFLRQKRLQSIAGYLHDRQCLVPHPVHHTSAPRVRAGRKVHAGPELHLLAQKQRLLEGREYQTSAQKREQGEQGERNA